MPLQLPVIDDLSWRDIVGAGRQGIATASDGRWTHHGPIDPGITLLELHAWIAEQQVHAFDHLTPGLRHALLRLAGVRPMPARAARTVMRVEVGEAPMAVAAGAVVERAGVRPACRFTFEHGLTAVPVARMGLVVGGRDRGLDLCRGGRVRPFALAGRSHFDLVWWFTAPPRALGGEPLTLLCLLDAPGGLAPDWAPPAPDDRVEGEPVVDVGPMLTLEWRYESRCGFRRFAPGALHDGTGGLRRSGLLRFSAPADWAPVDARAAGPWPFRIRVSTRMATGVVPPLIRGLIPNVAVAAHRWTASTRTRLQRPPLPGARVDLPIEGAPMLVDETRISLVERDGVAHAWRPTDTLALHGPSDRVFTVDAERGRIAFGDGRTGRQPVTPTAGGAVDVAFTLGGGPGGDIAPGLTWTGRDHPELTAVNVVPGVGGRAAEALTAAEQRAGALIARPERALALGDMVHLARTTSDVAIARAHAVVGYDPTRAGVWQVPGVVTLFVVPAVHPAPSGDAIDDDGRIDAPIPDAAALRAVAARLASRRPIGIELHVRPPCYRRIDLRCHANGDLVLRDRVSAALHDSLRRFLDPLDGGEVGRGWPFGGALIPSALLAVARRATEAFAHVDAIDLRLAGEREWQGCEPLALRPHELPCFSRLTLVYGPRRHAIGGLR